MTRMDREWVNEQYAISILSHNGLETVGIGNGSG